MKVTWGPREGPNHPILGLAALGWLSLVMMMLGCIALSLKMMVMIVVMMMIALLVALLFSDVVGDDHGHDYGGDDDAWLYCSSLGR